MPFKDEVRQLQAELAKLQAQQSRDASLIELQLAHFSTKLETLSKQVAAQESLTSNQTAPEPAQIDEFATDAQLSFRQTSKDTSLPIEPITNQALEQAAQTQTEELKEDPWQSMPEPQKAETKHTPKSLSWLDRKLLPIAQLLTVLLTSVFGPIAELTQQAKGFYRHYQAKDLGPVFLMTVAGIITFTLGFGYLLQYSINHWLSDLGKALLGLLAANGVIAGGLFIRYKKSAMEAFGSSLVGLGLILNYLCLYFLGPYFNLIPESASLGLLLANTILGYFLAFKLDTKVVAILALLGGSLAPLMLLSTSMAPLLYLVYLVAIGVCSLVQAYKLLWPALIETTALVHIACIQILSSYLALPLLILNGQTLIALLSLNVLFYLYAIGCLHLLKHISTSARLWIVPITMLASTLYTLYEFTPYAGSIFGINGIICGALYLLNKQSNQIRALWLLISGSFFGFAALLLFNQNLFAQIILLESLLLLWVASHNNFQTIRIQAYLLLFVGIGSNLLLLFEQLFSHFNQHHFDLCLTSIFSCGALYLAIKVMTHHREILTANEKRLSYGFKEGLSLLYLMSFILLTSLINSHYFLNTLPIMSLILLYISRKEQLKFTEVLAWLNLLPLVGLIAFGVLDVGSYSFSDQRLNVQLARIELFAVLLFAYYWYQKYYADATLVKLAYYVQLASFIALPLLFLPKTLRDYPEFLPIMLWVSNIMALGLAKFVSHKWLKFEAQVLTILATLMTASYCLAQVWQGLVALTLGGLLIGGILLWRDKLSHQWQAVTQLQLRLSPYYFALVIAVISQTLTSFFVGDGMFVQWQSQWGLTALIIAGYFTLLTQDHRPVGQGIKSRLKQATRPSFSVAYGLVYLFALCPLVLHFVSSTTTSIGLMLNLAELGSLILLYWYITAGGIGIKAHKRILSTRLLLLIWHGLLSINYLLWSYQLPTSVAAPISSILLVVHACILMIVSLKPEQGKIIRLASTYFALACAKILLLDMASFDLLQKVVAFMVIGGILLSVAYFYQKSKNTLAISNEQGS